MPTAGRRRPRRSTAAISAALFLGLVVVFAAPVPAAQAAAGSVSGSVFRDFDGDGGRDAGNTDEGVQTDLPMSGIHVVAHDAHNNVVGEDTTGTDGTYSIDTDSVADGTPLRIEFDDAQRPGDDNALPGDYQSSFHGDDNRTSVRFATAGAENIDFGVLDPEDYAAHDAPLIVGIQYAGLRTRDDAADLPAVAATPWAVPNNAAPDFPDRVELATYQQVGSVWGVAFDRPQNDAYVAANYKRISDLGPLGIGGIYKITDVLHDAGALNDPAGGSVQEWLDVNSLAGVDVGSVPSAAARGLGAPNGLTRDEDAFRNAGKVGIGGVATSENGDSLFFVNLKDKNVYALDVSGGAKPTSATKVNLASTLDDDQRPWAVSVHRDRLYVGYVDTDGDGADPGSKNGGSFHVVSTTVASAENGSPTWRNELTGSLGYVKGNAMANWGDGNPGNNPPAQVLRWNSWSDEWYWGDDDSQSVGFSTNWGWVQTYPQPILGSIAFDADGFMNIGFVDRTSVQGGNRQWASEPPPAGGDVDNRYYQTVSSGDLLLAAPGGAGANRFTLEDNGSVGDRAGASDTADQGPGGREFFNDRNNLGQGTNHYENTLGSVATYPGVPEVASTAMDPLDAVRLTGTTWFSLKDGTPERGYEHTRDPGAGDTPNDPFFQKGGGLGAVALLTREAPVEIGNRVWLDADFNGRQDADEPAIEGAVVQLFAADDGQPSGDALASTETDENGEYYFRSDDPKIDGFDPDGSYVVVFGKGSGDVQLHGPNADNSGFAGLTWDDLNFTKQEAKGAAINNDSNPDPANGRATVTVGDPGHNDHTIDAGFNATGTFAIQKLIDATGGQPVDGETFTFDVKAATDFRGDDVLDSIEQTPIKVEAGKTAPAEADRQQIPIGTKITIAERDAAKYDKITYDPSATQLITANSGRTTTFRVTDKLALPGSFTVEKLLTGDDAAIAAARDVSFNVVWKTKVSGQSGTISVRGGEVSDRVELPPGTVVQLTEAEPTNLPDGVDWDGYTWAPMDRVTISADGKTATITITSQQTVALELTNTVKTPPTTPPTTTPPTVPPKLPNTGSDVSLPLIIAGGLAVIGGVGALLISRRRGRLER